MYGYNAVMDSKDFAALILREAKKQGKKLNYTQLQKIMYICDGALLAYGENVVDEQCQVWDYGPVYPRAYKWYTKNKDNENFKISPKSELQYNNSHSIKMIIVQAIKTFADKSATALSDWSHQSGSPWSVTKDISGMYKPISKELMKEYFSKIIKVVAHE